MHRILNLVFSLSLILGPFTEPAVSPIQQPAPQNDQADAILAAMTPTEKVGQLFLVSFYGSTASENSDIYRLITEYRVGGVLLSAANDNITDTISAPTQVLTLTNQLQSAALEASQAPRAMPGVAASVPGPYVPLFVAMNHEGNGFPFTEVRTGLTELPSAMAIGATWDPSQAESMGRIAGTELAAMGVNFMLGPSLDVLETPRPEGTDLGSRVFGGDPFWVGVMGQAFIRGVHFGSGGRVAAIAKHFPGHGGSDRRPDDQVLPTVRKSFEQLQNFDLVPFFSVLDGQPADGTADGVLAAHIRFQGFQGNIRQVTPPLSFDSQAFGQLLALPAVAEWRSAGGLTVSDSLGVRAVKRFFDPALQDFGPRRIAGQAFNAGNDVLLLSEFGLNPRVDQTSYIIDTLVYFRQFYESDPVFAARVDAAVLRILTLKLRLYGGEFSPTSAVLPHSGLDVLGRDREDVMTLANAAAALISPTLDELASRAPEPPSINQRIVFFTDVRLGYQCSTCLRYPLLDKRQLELAVLQLYGPNGTNQTRANNLQSYSFEELAAYLENPELPAVGLETPTPEPAPVGQALNTADWIVFNMLNVTSSVPASRVVSAFLSQLPEIVRAKRVVVMAYDGPYYLDTTDLSNLTAYYALYSRAPDFVTTAARLLFRDLTPSGVPAVSVPSIGYDLIEITKPDPDLRIELMWQKVATAGEGTEEPPGLQLGDTITVTTGILLDRNGHQVPDQTPVRFRVTIEEGLTESFESPTINGVASLALLLNRPGQLQIDASSEPALLSDRFEINVQQDEVFEVTEIVPTPEPTDTPMPTQTPVPASPTPTPTEIATPVLPEPEVDRVDWRAFVMMCLGLVAVLVGGYRLGGNGQAHARQGIRVALAGAIGILAGYNYYALGMPGSMTAAESLEALAAPVFAIAGGLAGLALGWLYFVGRRNLINRS